MAKYREMKPPMVLVNLDTDEYTVFDQEHGTKTSIGVFKKGTPQWLALNHVSMYLSGCDAEFVAKRQPRPMVPSPDPGGS